MCHTVAIYVNSYRDHVSAVLFFKELLSVPGHHSLLLGIATCPCRELPTLQLCALLQNISA